MIQGDAKRSLQFHNVTLYREQRIPLPPSDRPFILQLPWLLHRHVDGPKAVQEPLIVY